MLTDETITTESAAEHAGWADEYRVVRRAYMQIDLVESAAHCTACDNISGYTLLRSHLERMCTAVVDHDGEVVKLLGDGLQACFTRPESALRCAVSFQEAVGRGADDPALSARVSLVYGDCVLYRLHERIDYYAREIILAARLATRGGDAGIVMSHAFRWQPRIGALLAPATVESETVRFKGFPAAVTVYHLRTGRRHLLAA